MATPGKHTLSLAFGAVIVCAALVYFVMRDSGPPPIPQVLDQDGKAIADPVISLEKVTLGGIDQTILIRGANADLPVLLILHGGPGGAIMPWVDLFQTPLLEQNFIVVHWDQRGAGSSYSEDLTVDDISPAQLIADTLELTDHLRGRFDEDKIFLAGQSWGSALGFMTIAENSEPFHAYVGASERVDWGRSMNMGYEWALNQARANNDADVLAQLEAIAPFDAFDEADLVVQREALDFYGAGDYHTPGLWDQYLDYAVSGQSPYYTTADIESYIPGLELSSAAIERRDLLREYNLFKMLPSVDIPVHFITGAEDWNTPAKLAREYYEFLEAPNKSFTVIKDAAHMVFYDQPETWEEALIEIKNAALAN